jgi:hypothetical protein
VAGPKAFRTKPSPSPWPGKFRGLALHILPEVSHPGDVRIISGGHRPDGNGGSSLVVTNLC